MDEAKDTEDACIPMCEGMFTDKAVLLQVLQSFCRPACNGMPPADFETFDFPDVAYQCPACAHLEAAF